MVRQTGYSSLQIAMHWLIAFLILGAYLTGDGMKGVFRERLQSGTTGLENTPIHGWLGIAVFALVLVRIVIRLTSGAPEAASGTPAILASAAVWGHRLLYLLMFAVPLGGFIAWAFGVREVGDIHETVGNIILWIAGLHAAAALFHQYVLKDGTLMRMLRPGD